MSSSPCGCDDTCIDPQTHFPYKCKQHREESLAAQYSGLPDMAALAAFKIRHFDSGATRNIDTSKFDYEAFLNPEALHAYAAFMHEHRLQKDGSLRDGDNWQKGLPFAAYAKSLVRHAFDLWRMHRGYAVTNPDTGLPHTKQELCCAILFNAFGYLKELVDPSAINEEKA